MSMIFPQSASTPARSCRAWGSASCALLLGLALYAVPAAPVQAQTCWAEGALGLDFGTVTPSGGHASSSTLRSVCRNDSSQTLHFRACLFLNPGQSNAIASRRMTNNNKAHMDYDLYADAAHTQIIGPAGSGHSVYSWTFSLAPGGGNVGQNIMVYGRVPPGQNLPAKHDFQDTDIIGLLRWRHGTSDAPPVTGDCLTGGAGGGQVDVSSSMITARFANACRIVTATDLEFGNVSVLDAARDQTSTIQLQCPIGTDWRVGLNEGSHASGGVRRMAGPGGSHIRYELYRDGGRSQRWGNTIDTDTSSGVGTGGTQSLTVHGRVPAQETPAAGTYSDTVTVTLTF